jgi:hypothetical protein
MGDVNVNFQIVSKEAAIYLQSKQIQIPKMLTKASVKNTIHT